ncbi:hypothetical protein BDV59DRAFT_14112 [Aspergillus ambiguus]|uniref:uncharacterized protein n=1 Tax=Aspergillus ambiguus TaxID=176160 RepID=UPI003CCD56D1
MHWLSARRTVPFISLEDAILSDAKVVLASQSRSSRNTRIIRPFTVLYNCASNYSSPRELPRALLRSYLDCFMLVRPFLTLRPLSIYVVVTKSP